MRTPGHTEAMPARWSSSGTIDSSIEMPLVKGSGANGWPAGRHGSLALLCCSLRSCAGVGPGSMGSSGMPMAPVSRGELIDP